MFKKGFDKVAQGPVPKGVVDSVGTTLKKWWGGAKPHVEGAMKHLKSGPAAAATVAGAAGGAVTGATSRDEYGRMRGLDGAIGGALKGGAVGAIGGATYNKYKGTPAVSEAVKNFKNKVKK